MKGWWSMDDDYLKPEKRLIEFSRYPTPALRPYRLGERTLILAVYAEGKRTFESKWDVARRNDDDGYYPVPEPTVYYVALAREVPSGFFWLHRVSRRLPPHAGSSGKDLPGPG